MEYRETEIAERVADGDGGAEERSCSVGVCSGMPGGSCLCPCDDEQALYRTGSGPSTSYVCGDCSTTFDTDQNFDSTLTSFTTTKTSIPQFAVKFRATRGVAGT